MPPVTRSQTKTVQTTEELAAAAAANFAPISNTSQPVKTAAPKKRTVQKKTTTKGSGAADPSAEFSKKQATKPAPKKRKARHTFTLNIDYVYWYEDSDENDFESASFIGTKASANRYFKQYLRHIKNNDPGAFGDRDYKIERLERDENGLFKFEYDDMPVILGRKREIMTLNMHMTMDLKDTKVEDDE